MSEDINKADEDLKEKLLDKTKGEEDTTVIDLAQASNKGYELSEREQAGEDMSNNKPYSFFLFVNPTSGGNKASEYTNMEAESISFFSINPDKKEPSKENYQTHVHIYDLKDKIKKERGFLNLKIAADEDKHNLRVIVGGGDGTVMWVIGEMLKHNVDVSRCPIGIIPFGTGNDFSRSLGWGGSAPKILIGKNLINLKSMIWNWIHSEIRNFDIWDVSIETHEGGCFKNIVHINGKGVKQVIMEKSASGVDVPMRTFNKPMSNYISIGIDGRIGMGFDKHRTKSRICNLCVYVCEGLKKLCVKTSRINSVVDRLEVEKDLADIDLKGSHLDIDIKNKSNKDNVLFRTKTGTTIDIRNKTEKKLITASLDNEEEEEKKGDKENTDINVGRAKRADSNTPKIAGNPACLLCLNISSYSAGSDVWACSNSKKVGLEFKKDKSKTIFEQQDSGDGKLEFLSFESSFNIGFEKIISGQAKKVAQGEGPFKLKLKERDRKGEIINTYFQIDGEFYQVIAPKVITIKLHPGLPNGKVKVLSLQK